ncbi:MAG: hypothetical protein ACMXYA_02010 [Candidatus Woesearchaeota archaeon]
MSMTERLSKIFIGVLYIAVGVIIYQRPELLYIGVSALLLIHGVIIIARVLLQKYLK